MRFDLEEDGEVLVEVDKDTFGVEWHPATRMMSFGLRSHWGWADDNLLDHKDGFGAFAEVMADEKQAQFGVELNSEAGPHRQDCRRSHFHVTLV